MARTIAAKTRWSKIDVENSLKAESKSFEEERDSAEEVISRRRPPREHKDKDLPAGFWRHDGKICHRQDKRTIEVITNFVVKARVATGKQLDDFGDVTVGQLGRQLLNPARNFVLGRRQCLAPDGEGLLPLDC